MSTCTFQKFEIQPEIRLDRKNDSTNENAKPKFEVGRGNKGHFKRNQNFIEGHNNNTHNKCFCNFYDILGPLGRYDHPWGKEKKINTHP